MTFGPLITPALFDDMAITVCQSEPLDHYIGKGDINVDSEISLMGTVVFPRGEHVT